jgi:transcription elongation factor GreB
LLSTATFSQKRPIPPVIPVGALFAFQTPLAMSKAVVSEPNVPNDDDDDGEPSTSPLPVGQKNYITRAGYERLRDEWQQLMDVERPKIVEVVHWAASNGDRSENGDYLYGKKRLRDMDRRIRFLTRRMACAQVVDPSIHRGSDQVFFGATVTYASADGEHITVTILGVDEANSAQHQISWVSPVARALLRCRVGDEVVLNTPQGPQCLEVLGVVYP